MGSKYLNILVGNKFGDLTVARNLGLNKEHRLMWSCICSCGKEVIKSTSALIGNNKNKCTHKTISSIPQENKILNKRGASKDYSGVKFNSLTVVKMVGTSLDRHIEWLLKCDICGYEFIKTSSRVVKKTSKCPICTENDRNTKIRPQKIINRDIAAFNKLYAHYKTSAGKRGFLFNLSKDKFLNITSLSCNYCGKLPINIYKAPGGGIYKYNGIDRVDNSKGYIDGNCVPCCKICNYMKHTNSLEDFKEQISMIYFHFIEKELNKKDVLH